MSTYVKLGEKAENFSDPLSGFDIVKGEVKELNPQQKSSPKVKRALTGGHLTSVTEKEFDEFKKKDAEAKKNIKPTAEPFTSKKEKEYKSKIKALEVKNEELETLNTQLTERVEELETENEELKAGVTDGDKNFDEMTKEELTTYYKEEFEVSEEQVTVFSKLTKEKMIVELNTLEADV